MIATADDRDDALGAGGEGAEGIDEGRHESAQTWVWKMSWAASTAFVRICEASCMASCARSTRHHDGGRVGSPGRWRAPGTALGGLGLAVGQRLQRLAEHVAEAAGRGGRRRRLRAASTGAMLPLGAR